MLSQFSKGIKYDHYHDFISTMEVLLLSSVNIPNNCVTLIHYDSKRFMEASLLWNDYKHFNS